MTFTFYIQYFRNCKFTSFSIYGNVNFPWLDKRVWCTTTTQLRDFLHNRRWIRSLPPPKMVEMHRGWHPSLNTFLPWKVTGSMLTFNQASARARRDSGSRSRGLFSSLFPNFSCSSFFTFASSSFLRRWGECDENKRRDRNTHLVCLCERDHEWFWLWEQFC